MVWIKLDQFCGGILVNTIIEGVFGFKQFAGIGCVSEVVFSIDTTLRLDLGYFKHKNSRSQALKVKLALRYS